MRKILGQQLGVAALKLVPSARLVEDLGARDVDIVELAVFLEDEFRVSVSKEQLKGMPTVGDWEEAAVAGERR